MNLTPAEQSTERKIKLSEEEALVALAYLGESATFKLLASQATEKTMQRRLLRVGLANYYIGYFRSDLDEVMIQKAPELFELDVPFDQRVPLLGAFILAADGRAATRPGILDGFEPVEVVTVAASARDELLELR
ncbi:MAG: hypothetical protein ABI602_01700 [Candidatus Saccharibacteria bacterium]